jgi:hypothetical protein
LLLRVWRSAVEFDTRLILVASYVLAIQFLLKHELPLVQPAEFVNLVLVLPADLDLVPGLFVGLGQL